MASFDTPKVINLGGQYTQLEALAGATITPGMLVIEQSDATDTVEPHGVEGGGGNPSFARELYEVGNTIDDNYASGETVIYYTFQPGAKVYALLAAGAVAVTKGANLTSAGDGTLQVAANGDIVIAQATEAVDNSGESETARIRVNIVSAFALNPEPAV